MIKISHFIISILYSVGLKAKIIEFLSKRPFLDRAARIIYSRMIGGFKYFKNDRKTKYIDIKLKTGILIRFDTAALIDMRGIGRVTREILKNLEALDWKECNTNRTVYFYSTIHWCPPTLPKGSCIMIHDVIPLVLPEYFGNVVSVWEKTYAPIARQASLILTVSETSAQDISTHLNIPMEKIRVAHNGVTNLPLRSEVYPVSERYIVYLGSNDQHKNLGVVIEALSLLSDIDISLYLIGVNSNIMAKAKECGISNRIKVLGRLHDDDIGNIIKNSIALVFPSLYEGFGLPPLEAALIGTPSICSTRPAMTETLAGSAIFCDPENPSQWASAIRLLTTDEDYRSLMAEKAYTAASLYTWNSFMEKFIPTLIEASAPDK